MISGHSESLIKDVKGPDYSGFIYSEFKNYPEIYLIPSPLHHYTQFSNEEAEEWISENEIKESSSFFQTPDDNYRSLVRRCIDLTRQWDSFESTDMGNGCSKVVVSRVSRQKCAISPLELFGRLNEAYPSACVFIFSTNLHGTWIGASPEPILQVSDGKISSLSLAGTRWDDNEEEWDIKNIQEQAIVTKFIASGFAKFGLNPTLNGPFTLKAGPVMHLATEISAQGELEDFRLLRYLCPTPALSGFPREKAIAEIMTGEQPHRSCYGGLIGWVNNNRNYSSYANLRSGRYDLLSSSIDLRAGGGITHLSQPEKEWEETEKKLQTLIKFIEKR
ncbi:MAG: chorismate-binding protein [Muribaculaceae bacterium]|nr:chorismate-binding protein [Muribaculaceae bacterium]